MTSVSRYVTKASRYQSRSSMYIRGLIPRNSTALAEAVLIVTYVGQIFVWTVLRNNPVSLSDKAIIIHRRNRLKKFDFAGILDVDLHTYNTSGYGHSQSNRSLKDYTMYRHISINN